MNRADCYAAADVAVKQKAADFRAAESERINKLYDRYPQLGLIEKALRDNIRQFSVFALSGNTSEEAFNEFRVKSLNLQDERRKILNQYGLDEDVIKVHYRCEKCKDNGFTDDGWCECFKKELSKQFLEISNISEKNRKLNFRSFDLSFYEKPNDNTQMTKTLEYSKQYVKKFADSHKNMLFMGRSGSGKTFLSCAIACELIEKGNFVFYTTAQDMISALESEKFNKDDKKDTKSLFEADLLVIDDLGSEYRTQFADSALYNVVNSRINSGKPMIISTNYGAEEIEAEYHERISSRLLNEFMTIPFADVDIRALKKFREA